MSHNPNHVVLFHHLRQVLQRANAEQIDVIPLKGAHLLTRYYPVDEDRGFMADVDVLVRKRDLDRMCTLMESLGYVRRTVGNRRYTEAHPRDVGFEILLSGNSRILVEVHRHLVHPARHPIDYDALWNRATLSTIEGERCLRMSPEDTILHTIVHLFSDRFSELPRSMRDLEVVIASGEVDLSLVCRRAAEWQCRRAAWLAFSLLYAHNHNASILPIIAELAPPSAVQAVLNYLVPGAQGFRFADLGMRREEAILWPWLMDGVFPLMRYVTWYASLRARDLIAR